MKNSRNKFMCLILTIAIILVSMFATSISVEAAVSSQTVPNGSYFITLTDFPSKNFTSPETPYDDFSVSTQSSTTMWEVKQYSNSYTISTGGLYLYVYDSLGYEIGLGEFDETQVEAYLFDFSYNGAGYRISPNALPGYYISVIDDNVSLHEGLVVYAGEYTDYWAFNWTFRETFQLEDGAEYCIKSKSIGKYITSMPNDSATCEVLADADPEYLDYKIFTITKVSNSTNIFYIHNGDGYLSVRSSDGKMISKSNPDDSCKFKIESMQNGNFTITSNSNYRLAPVLERRNYYIAQGTPLNGYIWNFEKVYSDPISINSKLAFDASPQAGFIIKYNQPNTFHIELNVPCDSTIIYKRSTYSDSEFSGQMAVLITPKYISNVNFKRIYQWN